MRSGKGMPLGNQTASYRPWDGRFPPAGACDTHIHVFGPAAKYPFVQGRTYTPGDALPADAAAMLEQLGLERVVLVQPSVYPGTDNRRLLDALDEFGTRARGVTVIDDATSEDELAHPCISRRKRSPAQCCGVVPWEPRRIYP